MAKALQALRTAVATGDSSAARAVVSQYVEAFAETGGPRTAAGDRFKVPNS